MLIGWRRWFQVPEAMAAAITAFGLPLALHVLFLATYRGVLPDGSPDDEPWRAFLVNSLLLVGMLPFEFVGYLIVFGLHPPVRTIRLTHAFWSLGFAAVALALYLLLPTFIAALLAAAPFVFVGRLLLFGPRPPVRIVRRAHAFWSLGLAGAAGALSVLIGAETWYESAFFGLLALVAAEAGFLTGSAVGWLLERQTPACRMPSPPSC